MMLFFPKRDDDNTTQGKLAYGCMVMIWLVISLAIFIAIAQTFTDRKSTRLNSSHIQKSRMPSSA